jgi:hypothetical protein
MTREPFAEFEQQVRLVLAPDLPDATQRHPAEVEQHIRRAMQDVLTAAGDEVPPLTRADRAAIAERLTAEVLRGDAARW